MDPIGWWSLYSLAGPGVYIAEARSASFSPVYLDSDSYSADYPSKKKLNALISSFWCFPFLPGFSFVNGV